MTTGLHVQNNKAFLDRMRRITSYFTAESCAERCSTEFASEDDNVSNFIP